jgi:hypothetical protein
MRFKGEGGKGKRGRLRLENESAVVDGGDISCTALIPQTRSLDNIVISNTQQHAYKAKKSRCTFRIRDGQARGAAFPTD